MLEWLWSAPCESESVQPVYRWSSGLASVRPRLWQTALARLSWARCSLSKVAAGVPLNSALQQSSLEATMLHTSVEVASLCNVSRVTVEPQVLINAHAKWLELRCNRQSASGNVDSGDVGSWPELSRDAEKDHFWLVRVELEAILHKPEANCGWAVSKPVDGQGGIGTGESWKKKCGQRTLSTVGGKCRWQHKTELDGEEWSVAMFHREWQGVSEVELWVIHGICEYIVDVIIWWYWCWLHL